MRFLEGEFQPKGNFSICQGEFHSDGKFNCDPGTGTNDVITDDIGRLLGILFINFNNYVNVDYNMSVFATNGCTFIVSTV